MRFSAYFEEAARLSAIDPAQAEKLLREAEAHSLASVPEHLNHCAKVWMACLHDRDNAMRCLLLNECRTAPDDQAALLEITEAYLVIVRDFASAERCFKKALAAATPAETERFREFLEKYGRKDNPTLLAVNGDSTLLAVMSTAKPHGMTESGGPPEITVEPEAERGRGASNGDSAVF